MPQLLRQFSAAFLLIGFFTGLPTTAYAVFTINDAQIIGWAASSDPRYQWQLELQLDQQQRTLLLNSTDTHHQLLLLDTDGVPREQSTSHSLFSGKIQNVGNSWVRLSLAGEGKKQRLRGAIYEAGTYYEIQPAQAIPTGHYRASRYGGDAFKDVLPGYRRAGHDIELFPPATPFTRRDTRQAIAITQNQSEFFRATEDATVVVHVGIVIDSLFDDASGGHGLDVAVDSINVADGLFRHSFGVALRLDTILLMSDPLSDELIFDRLTSTDLLLEFRKFRQQSEALGSNVSVVHFFTGNTTTDSHIGQAFIGAACRTDGYDVSLSVPFQYPALLTAHEIAHNLGAIHDESTSCSTDNDFIMYSHISSQTTDQFSQCTIEDVREPLNLVSSCHTDAIDVALAIDIATDTETATLTATNLDLSRQVAGMQIRMEISGGTFTALPATCEIEDPEHALCPVTAVAATSSAGIRVRYQLAEDSQARLTAQLRPIGFIDLRPDNNDAVATITLPAPAVLALGTTVESGGGGLFQLWMLLILLPVSCHLRVKRR